MKKLFKLSSLYPLLLVVYIVKSFIVDPSYFDFGVLFLMTYGFSRKIELEKNEYSDKDEILDKFVKLEEQYKNDIKEISEHNENQLNSLEDKVSRNALGMGFKPQNLKDSFGKQQR